MQTISDTKFVIHPSQEPPDGEGAQAAYMFEANV
jgi:hypothetical protein